MLTIWVLFILGLILIIISGDKFVDSAIVLAKKTGIPKMVIGATIVSLATTLPELTVSSMAVLNGSNSMAIGNAIGSVICNTSLIAAISIIFLPGIIKGDFKIKGIILLTSLFILFILSLDNSIGKIDAIILFILLAIYIFINLSEAKKTKESNKDDSDNKNMVFIIIMFILSTAGIVLGSRMLVDNGTKIAITLGVPESVIALTMIALGTSLPELTTSISAIIKKEKSLAIGNIIGANILNIVLIIPTCAMLSKGFLELTTQKIFNQLVNVTGKIDLPFAIVVCSLFIIPPILFKKTTKKQGYILLALYTAYLVFLFVFVK